MPDLWHVTGDRNYTIYQQLPDTSAIVITYNVKAGASFSTPQNMHQD